MEGITAMRLSKQHFEMIADVVGPLVSWPSHLHTVADELEKTNAKFDREKFLQRAFKAWERKYELPTIDDNIPY